MLKHGRVSPRKKGWTMRYLRRLREQHFEQPADQIALQEMVEPAPTSNERAGRPKAGIAEFVPNWSLAPIVQALQTLRSVELIVAVILARKGEGRARARAKERSLGRPFKLDPA
jgi:hypothetical protein